VVACIMARARYVIRRAPQSHKCKILVAMILASSSFFSSYGSGPSDPLSATADSGLIAEAARYIQGAHLSTMVLIFQSSGPRSTRLRGVTFAVKR